MRRFYCTLLIALSIGAVGGAGPVPPKGAHVLQGPYAFDEKGKPLPEHYYLDDKRVHTVAELKAAVSQLPPGSLVYFDGTCTSTESIELGRRPYMTFSAFKRFCQSHQMGFDWHVGL
jgi:hypothetical protein